VPGFGMRAPSGLVRDSYPEDSRTIPSRPGQLLVLLTAAAGRGGLFALTLVA
jgi:hypothetical protein